MKDVSYKATRKGLGVATESSIQLEAWVTSITTEEPVGGRKGG